MKLDTSNGPVLVLEGEEALFVAMLFQSGINTSRSVRGDNPDMVAFCEACEQVRKTLFDERTGLDSQQLVLWERLKKPVFDLRTFEGSTRRAKRRLRTREERAQLEAYARASAIASSLRLAVKAKRLSEHSPEVFQHLEHAVGDLHGAAIKACE